jgi:ribose transport system substrate-binding protein
MKKEIKWFVVMILFLAVTTVCFSSEKPEVAVLLPGSVEFFSVERIGLNQAAEEFGLELLYADAQWDAGMQLSQVENYIARGVDLILLCAADNMALRSAVNACKNAGVPLITFTNTVGPDPLGKYPGVISFIGRSDYNGGVLQGHIVEDIVGSEEVDIVLIEGNPGTAPQRLREEGFLSVAANNPNWNIIEKRPIKGWTKEGTLEFMEAFIQTGKNVDIVACQWWSGAIAASMALKERGIEDVKIIGLEFAKELVPYIENGDIYATTYFSVVEEGYKAVEAAYKYLNGETIPEFIEIEQVVVTKDNIDEFEPEM